MVKDGVADATHGWFECYEMRRGAATSRSRRRRCSAPGGRSTPPSATSTCEPGDDILIFGAGPVGLSFVKFGKLLGLGWVGRGRPDRAQTARGPADGRRRGVRSGLAGAGNAAAARKRWTPWSTRWEPGDHQRRSASGQHGRHDRRLRRDATGHRPRETGAVQLQPLVHQWPTRCRETGPRRNRSANGSARAS